jgi:hypothetical protein
MKCKYQLAWIGQCKNHADKSGFCEEHKNIVCDSCGEKATRECEETGQFVCGVPLCSKCTHSIHPEGHNGGIGFNTLPFPDDMKDHCRKSKQRYAPWFVTEDTLQMWKDENGIINDVILTNKEVTND